MGHVPEASGGRLPALKRTSEQTDHTLVRMPNRQLHNASHIELKTLALKENEEEEDQPQRRVSMNAAEKYHAL